MNCSQTVPYVVFALSLGFMAVSPAADSPAALEIPAALKSTAAEIPADRNHLTRFLEAFGKGSPELTKKVNEATD